MKFITFLFILIGLILIIEKIINRLLGVQKKKLSETPGKKIDQWGNRVILVTFLSTLWFVIPTGSDIMIKLYWMTYLLLILGFQAIMEFIYIKNSKQYVSTTILLILSLIFLYNIDNISF